MMKRYKKLFEAKQVGVLYHYTSFENAIKIIQSNILKVGKTGYVSFTRNKFLYKQATFISGSDCFLSLDGNKISENYKIIPFKYHGIDYTEIGDESEETLKRGKSLKNVKKYILDITLLKNRFPEEYEKNYYKKTLFISRFLNVPQEIVDLELLEDFFRDNRIKVKII